MAHGVVISSGALTHSENHGYEIMPFMVLILWNLEAVMGMNSVFTSCATDSGSILTIDRTKCAGLVCAENRVKFASGGRFVYSVIGFGAFQPNVNLTP
jgi:hypothetical protein